MVAQPMSVIGLSARGATVETATLLQLDSLHEIRLTLGDRALVLKARVVHAHITEVGRDEVTYEAGLEFPDPGDAASTEISRFLARLDDARRLPPE